MYKIVLWSMGILMKAPVMVFFVMGPVVAADLSVQDDLNAMVRVPVPTVNDFTKSLRPGHPRLTLNDDRIQQLRTLIKSDPAAAAWYRGVQNNAAWYLAQADIPYVPEPVPGQRAQVRPMLWPGRDFMDRVYTLGLVVSMDHDPQALARLRQEVLHALDTWKDWSGSIATFEIAAGMGLAYDWLFDQWSEGERSRIRVAINDLAFNEYQNLRKTIMKAVAEKRTIPRNNVVLVQLCGAAVAALATLEEQPETSGPVLTTSFALMQGVLRGFGDQGSWFEGVNYWNFGIQHLVQYLASLQTSMGGDFGLISSHQFPGVEKTAYFPLFMSGPTGGVFNYADTYEGVFSSPSLLWLGSAYQCVGAWQYEANLGKNMIFDTKVTTAPKIGHPRNLALRLMYYRPMPQDALSVRSQPPLDMIYSGDEVASLRSSWTDPSAVFVGIKGGSAKGNPHAHLDAGTVIMEAFGKRWLSEIPPPRYGRGDWPYAKRYMNEDRFLFFQARTEAHNTLLIDPASS